MSNEDLHALVGIPLVSADVVHEDLRQILLALGLGDHARTYSSHEVVQREILPAIRQLHLRQHCTRPHWTPFEDSQ
jgi:hypothetical protein